MLELERTVTRLELHLRCIHELVNKCKTPDSYKPQPFDRFVYASCNIRDKYSVTGQMPMSFRNSTTYVNN